MAGDLTASPAAQAVRAPAENRAAKYCRCVTVHGQDRVSVAAAAARVSAVYHRAELFLCVARQRHSGADQLRIVGGNPRSRGLRSQPLGRDLPLAEEIDIVFSRCPLAVVMVDDFQVPSDAGYG